MNDYPSESTNSIKVIKRKSGFKYLYKSKIITNGFLVSNQRLNNIVYWFIKIMVLGILIKLIFDVGNRVEDKKYHLKNFEVPDELKSKGISGEIIATYILQDINFIDSQSSFNKPIFGQYHIPHQKFVIDIADNTEEIVYSGVSYKRLVGFISNIFSTRKYISGNVIRNEVNNNVIMCSNSSDNKYLTTIASEDSIFLDEKIRLLAFRTAEDIYSKMNPLQYSLFIYSMKDYKRCVSFIENNFDKFKSTSDKVNAYWIKGVSLAMSAKNKDAIVSFKSAASLDATLFNNNVNIAYSYCLLNEFDSALQYIKLIEFRKISKGGLNEYYNLKGNYYTFIKKYDSAIYFYKKSIATNSKYYEFRNLAASYASIGKFDSASYYFDSFRTLYSTTEFDNDIYGVAFGFWDGTPDSESNLVFQNKNKVADYKYGCYFIAKYYKDLNQFDTAKTYLKKALLLDSTFSEANHLFARICFEEFKFHLANEYFNKAYNHNKFSAQILIDWAYNYLQQNDYGSALEKTYLLSNKAEPIRKYSLLGDIYFEKGDLTRADYFYKFSMELNSNYIYNLNKLVELKMKQYDFPTATFYCNRVLDNDSNNIYALSNIQTCKLNLHKVGEIDFIADKLLRLKDSTSAYISKARKERYLNNTEGEKYFYLKAYNINKDNEETLQHLARYYSLKSQFDQALIYWKKLEELYILNAEDYNSIGACYAKKGICNKAIDYFKKSLSLDPSNCLTLKNWAICIVHLKKNPYADQLFSSFKNNIDNCDIESFLDLLWNQR